jgi:2,3-dimethylmalate lyase
MTSNAARLREMIAADEMPIFPGAYDGLSARLVQRAGFPGIYFSGGLSASSFPGYPDFGIRTLTEAVAQVGGAVRSTRMPVIADAEAGYGSVLTVQRLVWELENVGTAGMHMEDQDVPRRCGHYAEKRLVSAEEHAGRIAAAVEARRDPDFVIIARTDAVSVSGFEDAVARCHKYVEAGADMVFFDGIETREQLEEAPKLFEVPVMANMVEGGKTPIPPAKELEAMGYALTIYSTVLYFTAMGAMRDALSTLKEAETSEPLWDTMGGFREWQEVTQVDEYLDIVDRFEPEASDAAV